MHQKLAHSVLIAVVVLALLAVSIQAYPSWRGSRQKRVSDQRLAELQTLLAIARLKGKMTSSSGKYYGYVDPSKIGRKKRSQAIPADESQLDNHVEYESRADDDRDSAESQEEVYDDIWRYLRSNNKIR
ncbi:uncharacterized protein LOC124311506 [Daphnia pulicaria]|uniref:uncharacterized protein LOC124311506 n=1 Tax=Daphnia pulicaria TaxID=35523 RepID=UPI001EEC8DF9|nr:uncharacterized protein LOC124311506 [Daphnia pulicaria]